jgi:hypothetical protein
VSRAFNGTSDKILCGTGSALNPAAITVLCWIYPTSFSHLYQVPVDRSSVGAVNDGDYKLAIKSTGSLAVYVNQGGVLSFVDPASNSLTTNAWNTAGFVASAATGLIVYTNGVSSGTFANSNALGTGNTQTFKIGTDSPNNVDYFVAGSIAEVAVWSVALTSTEVTAYNNGAPAKTIQPSSLVGYWPLRGYSPEPDLSGNANNGTLTGTTVDYQPPPFVVWSPQLNGADRERLPPVRRSPDEPFPFFTRSPNPVPTRAPPRTGENRERDPPPVRRPDEPFPFFVRSPNPVPTTRRLPTAGIDRERLPPVQRSLDEPPGPFFTRSPNPVPTTRRLPTAGIDRERLPPVQRSLDEPPGPFFMRSLHPVPTKWLPTAGEAERLPAIKRPPDEPPGAFIINSLSTAPAPIFALPRSYEDARPPPIRENFDPARQWFVRSPSPVPSFVVPKSGEDIERIFPIRENLDPAKQWFVRSPSPVPGFAWFGAWDQPQSRLSVDQYITVWPAQPPPGAAVSVPLRSATDDNRPPGVGSISDQYTTSWVPFATSAPIVVTVAVHAPQFFSTMGSMIGSPANPPS